jgi:hypothetical protein
MSIVHFVRVDCAEGPVLALSAKHAPDSASDLTHRFEALRELRAGNGCEAILFLGVDDRGVLGGVCVDSYGRPSRAGVPAAMNALVKIGAIDADAVATVNGQSARADSSVRWCLAARGLCVD